MSTPAYSNLLKIIKKSYSILNHEDSNFGRNWKMFPMKDYANTLIYNALIDDKPLMITRFGSTELTCLSNYIGVKDVNKYKNYKSFIQSKTPPWWWELKIIEQMQNWSGFFPTKIDKIEQFCELMLEDMKNVDILGSWLKEECFFQESLVNSNFVMLEDLEPFFSTTPWTKALKNKRVLVVHPFAETIEEQYQFREHLFDNELLPQFDLLTIKAVQSIAKEKTQFNDWFEALDSMKNEISNKEFDICILGCGAYGFPLASYVKSIGKKAIHLGGATQLLFGIKGKRWENYLVYPYRNLYNDYWVRPKETDKPKMANIVEGACYW